MPGNEFADLSFVGLGAFDLVGPTPALFDGLNIQSVGSIDIREGSTLADFGGFDIKTLPATSVAVAAMAQKYRMRGYRVATSQYEHWVTTDPTAAPPSGNTLVAIVIEARLPSTA
jgi:hypothetical protein